MVGPFIYILIELIYIYQFVHNASPVQTGDDTFGFVLCNFSGRSNTYHIADEEATLFVHFLGHNLLRPCQTYPAEVAHYCRISGNKQMIPLNIFQIKDVFYTAPYK